MLAAIRRASSLVGETVSEVKLAPTCRRGSDLILQQAVGPSPICVRWLTVLLPTANFSPSVRLSGMQFGANSRPSVYRANRFALSHSEWLLRIAANYAARLPDWVNIYRPGVCAGPLSAHHRDEVQRAKRLECARSGQWNCQTGSFEIVSVTRAVRSVVCNGCLLEISRRHDGFAVTHYAAG